jgi:hypothetical protein
MQIPEDTKTTDTKPLVMRSEAKRQFYVENFKKSGLSIRDFCRENNLAFSSFHKWLRSAMKESAAFKPLQVREASSAKPPLLDESIELQFEGKVKLILSNIKNPNLIIAIIKGLAK